MTVGAHVPGLAAAFAQLETLRSTTGLPLRLLLVLAYCAVASAWLYAQAKRRPPGWQRLAVAAPVVLMNMLMPLLIDRAHARGHQCLTASAACKGIACHVPVAGGAQPRQRYVQRPRSPLSWCG